MTENECVNERHPFVKYVNLTNTARSVENGLCDIKISDLE